MAIRGCKVFAGVKAHPESNWTVRVSYLEIYNEQCYDLLDISTQPSDIAIVEDNKDRVVVKGLATPVAATEAEALQHLFEVPLKCNYAFSAVISFCQGIEQCTPSLLSTCSFVFTC